MRDSVKLWRLWDEIGARKVKLHIHHRRSIRLRHGFLWELLEDFSAALGAGVGKI